MKSKQEIAEEIRDKYSCYIDDTLSGFEMVSGRNIILPNDIIPMLLLAMDEHAKQLAQECISELRRDRQVYTAGEAAIKSYCINLIKQTFDLK